LRIILSPQSIRWERIGRLVRWGILTSLTFPKFPVRLKRYAR
jgi:hypothetical protein